MTSEDLSQRVHVVVHFRLLPEAEPRLLEVFKAAAEPTRAEPACIKYELYRGIEDEHQLVLVEEWRDQAGLAAHLKQPYIAAVQAILPEVLAEPIKMQMLSARS